jgi:hypothetical protein
LELSVVDLNDGTPPARLTLPVRREPGRLYGGIGIDIDIPEWQGTVHWDDWVPASGPSSAGEHVTRALRFVCDAE